MEILGVIPARYKSSRFPGKALQPLLGKPMVLWVCELTSKALGDVVVATDDNRILKVVNRAGFKAVMTSEDHLTGTDRLAEVAQKIRADIYVNIQGDEPTLNPESIKKVVEVKKARFNKVVNAMTAIKDEDLASMNVPKVVFNRYYEMVYMSRLPIPGYMKIKPEKYYKQVCIYAFNRDELLKFGEYPDKGLAERHEDIEILRFFELEIPVLMVEVEGETYAVDVPEDVSVVEKRLKELI